MYGAGAEYALHSLLILATRPDPVSVRDLATYQQIPERFLAKIFTRLKKADRQYDAAMRAAAKRSGVKVPKLLLAD